MLSSKHSYGNKGSFKYFIGYINIGNTFPKYFDNNNKHANLLIHDKKLLKKYNEIWDKISNLLKKGLTVDQCIMINALKRK